MLAAFFLFSLVPIIAPGMGWQADFMVQSTGSSQNTKRKRRSQWGGKMS
jgi:hypothetical protein